MVSVRYLLKGLVYWIEILYTGIYVGQIRFRVKSIYYFGSYGPFLTLKNGFRFITFEKISVLDSYFIHKHIIIKYRSSSI